MDDKIKITLNVKTDLLDCVDRAASEYGINRTSMIILLLRKGLAYEEDCKQLPFS